MGFCEKYKKYPKIISLCLLGKYPSIWHLWNLANCISWKIIEKPIGKVPIEIIFVIFSARNVKANKIR